MKIAELKKGLDVGDYGEQLLDYISETLLAEKSTGEMTNIIYDTLMHNKDFPQFDVDNVDWCLCNNTDDAIDVCYMGHEYRITITSV